MTAVKRTVLILCTGNSARSQIAEALINARLGDRWKALSAGTEPAAAVHPLGRQVLEEIGIRHAGVPKHVEVFRGRSFDQVITVCDDAAEACPIWLGEGFKVHIGFPDPAKAGGSQAEVLQAFRAVRDGISDRVIGYLESIPPNPSGR